MRFSTCAGYVVLAALLTACGPVGVKPGGGGAGAKGAAPGMPVVGVMAKKQPVSETVSLVGTLAANEAVEVKAETDGIVVETLFQEGEVVEKGGLLLRLDETKLAADLAQVKAGLNLAEANHERAKELLRDKLVSQQEYDQAASTYEVARASMERQERLLKDAAVRAPFRGRTGARNVSPGQVITRNTAITWLVDLDPMKVEMNVPERFLSQVREGQQVGFEVAAYPGKRFTGEIYFVASRLDLGTRTALVKTRIANGEGILKAGMVASLELKLQIRESAILVPEVALISNGDQYSVFVVDGQSRAEMRAVEVGQRLPRWVEIRSGLKEGETVVVEGHQKIGPGAPVVLAPSAKGAIYEGLEHHVPAPLATQGAAGSTN